MIITYITHTKDYVGCVHIVKVRSQPWNHQPHHFETRFLTGTWGSLIKVGWLVGQWVTGIPQSPAPQCGDGSQCKQHTQLSGPQAKAWDPSSPSSACLTF